MYHIYYRSMVMCPFLKNLLPPFIPQYYLISPLM